MEKDGTSQQEYVAATIRELAQNEDENVGKLVKLNYGKVKSNTHKSEYIYAGDGVLVEAEKLIGPYSNFFIPSNYKRDWQGTYCRKIGEYYGTINDKRSE